MKYGTFSGNPITEWLVAKKGTDRDMRLVEDFSYTDPSGRTWLAKKGAVINGASIPQPLWSTIGSPYTDDYRRASVVHDVACDDPQVDRKEADVMFYYACLAGGCGLMQARILYAGVRIGSWSSQAFPSEAMSGKRLLFRPLDQPRQPEEQFLKAKLDAISTDLRALPKKAGIKEFDAVIAKHIKV